MAGHEQPSAVGERVDLAALQVGTQRLASVVDVSGWAEAELSSGTETVNSMVPPVNKQLRKHVLFQRGCDYPSGLDLSNKLTSDFPYSLV